MNDSNSLYTANALFSTHHFYVVTVKSFKTVRSLRKSVLSWCTRDGHVWALLHWKWMWSCRWQCERAWGHLKVSSNYGRGAYIFRRACGVLAITLHCASWPSEQTALVYNTEVQKSMKSIARILAMRILLCAKKIKITTFFSTIRLCLSSSP